MYTVSVTGWDVTTWWNKTIKKHINDSVTHLTYKLETRGEPEALHVNWGQDGLGFYRQSVLERAWGPGQDLVLGTAPSFEFPSGVKGATDWDAYKHLAWNLIGRPGWCRPRSCVTLCHELAISQGLDWSMVPARFEIAR